MEGTLFFKLTLLLFAGACNCEDIKQEILQNTLDRYDDLIAQQGTYYQLYTGAFELE